MTKKENFLKGIISENPLFVTILGTCPALAITTSLTAGLGMGIAFTVVLILSNLMISLVRKIVPDEVRIPSYIVIIATIVTIVEMLINAYFPDIYALLGIFLPLIVVNCNILGRAEAFASKNTIVDSVIDAIGMGIGFTFALVAISFIREVFGAGTFFGWDFWAKSIDKIPFINVDPIGVLTSPAGAFLTLGLLIWAFNAFRANLEKKTADE